jgi:hypothetical protein
MVTQASGYPTITNAITISTGLTSTINPIVGGPSAGNITGLITSAVDGHPLVGASVTNGTTTASTDATGHYTLTGVAPGVYTVTAQAAGWQTQSTQVTVTSGVATTINLKLATCGQLIGTVKRGGAPAAGATVTVQGGVVSTWNMVVVKADGTYSMGWIPVGTYTVTAAVSGLPAQTRTVTISAGTSLTSNFSF